MSSIEELIISLADGVSELNDATIYATGAYILAGNDVGVDTYDGLFRWQGIDIPDSATILSATFKPYLGAISTNAFAGNIQGIDEDNMAVWDATDRGSTRDKTTAIVNADADQWGNYVVGNWITIDITAIIQEIVDRAGWEAGNDLGIVIDSDVSAGNDDQISLHRYYGSYIEDPLLYSPQLIVQYGASPYDGWTPVLASIIR